MSEAIAQESMEYNARDVYRDGGSLFVRVTALNHHFVPPEVIEQYAHYGDNKEVRVQHGIPEKDISALVGHIHECKAENGELKILAEVWGYNEKLKELQRQIIDGEMEVSLGYKKTMADDDEIVGIYIRELSFTPRPRCTPEMGCGVEAILETGSESMVINTMPKPADGSEAPGGTPPEALEMLERTLGSQTKERGERIVELEAALSSLGDKLKVANESITQLSTDKKELIEKLAVAEKKLVAAETLEIRKEIVQMQGVSDDEAKKVEIEKLAQLSRDELQRTHSMLKRVVDIHKKAARSATPPVTGRVNEGVDTLGEKSARDVALELNPDLRRLVEAAKSKGGPPGLGVTSPEDMPFI